MELDFRTSLAQPSSKASLVLTLWITNAFPQALVLSEQQLKKKKIRAWQTGKAFVIRLLTNGAANKAAPAS